jgi:hypothetical protein
MSKPRRMTEAELLRIEAAAAARRADRERRESERRTEDDEARGDDPLTWMAENGAQLTVACVKQYGTLTWEITWDVGGVYMGADVEPIMASGETLAEAIETCLRKYY